MAAILAHIAGITNPRMLMQAQVGTIYTYCGKPMYVELVAIMGTAGLLQRVYAIRIGGASIATVWREYFFISLV